MTTSTTTEETRSTEPIKVRVPPAEAESIRATAKAAGQTISDYIVNLHNRRISRAPEDLRQFAALAEINRHLTAIPDTVRKLDADLGRLSGRLKDLFNDHPAKAMAHQDAINEALRSVRDLREEIMPVLADLQVAIAEPRDALTDVMKATVRRRA